MPRNPQGLGRLLRQVMVRTRREDTAIPFPRRTAETVIVTLTPEERALYDDVTQFVRQTCQDQDLRRAAAGWHLTLLVLQKEIGSSTRAAVHTLEKLKARAPEPTVRAAAEALAARARAIEGASKLAHLCAILEGSDDKAIIFTQFRGTLHYLAEALRGRGLEVSTFYGGMSDAQREDAIRRFRQSARILVSTDAGGEGGNLQFCRRVINFDLPWNPMKVEQRIGRVHRLGQERDVFVHNFSAQATLEARVLEILQLKLNMFELVVGELDLILGNYPEAPAIEETVFRIWTSSTDEREIDRGFRKLGEDLEVARQRYERIRELDREIFDLLRTENGE
jgi:SNF2 family DNA or RNA helicase